MKLNRLKLCGGYRIREQSVIGIDEHPDRADPLSRQSGKRRRLLR